MKMTRRLTTLIEYLAHHGETRPDALYSRYLFSDREPVELTFGEQLERTRRFAAGYAAHGVARGDVVLVILEHHEDLMPAFLGATWLGAVPVFLPHPNPKTNIDRYFVNLRAGRFTDARKVVLSR